MSAEPSLKHQEQSNKLIYWSLGTIFLIAASLNYDALRHFAYDQAEVNYYLSFFVPLLVDVLIATAVYITLINEESGEKPGLAWSVVIASPAVASISTTCTTLRPFLATPCPPSSPLSCSWPAS